MEDGGRFRVVGGGGVKAMMGLSFILNLVNKLSIIKQLHVSILYVIYN